MSRNRPWLGSTLLAVIATAALSVAASGDGVLPGDAAVARWLQDAPVPGAEGLARIATAGGSAPAIIGLAAPLALLLAWRGQPRWAGLLVAVVLLRALNPALKLVIASPRPTADLVRVEELATRHGFPSGHAMGVALLFGGTIWLAERMIERGLVRRLVQTAAILVILVTGFGRVYVGAHWPSDVLGGYLWGVTCLLLLVPWLQGPGDAERGNRREPGAQAAGRTPAPGSPAGSGKPPPGLAVAAGIGRLREGHRRGSPAKRSSPLAGRRLIGPTGASRPALSGRFPFTLVHPRSWNRSPPTTGTFTPPG